MAGSQTQALFSSEDAHLVLYDGVCGLCNHLLQFLLEHDRRSVFTFASLQSDAGKAALDRFGASSNELTSFYVLANYRVDGARMFNRSDAALFVAAELGWPWKAAVLAGVLPRPIRERLYNLIARNRYRLFGRFDHCLAPRPEFRRRFIDS